MFVNMQTVLGLCLLTMQIALAAVLLRELWRTRAADGVAVLGELAWVIAGAGWVWYGLWVHSYIVAISGAIAVMCCAIVCLLVRRGVTVGQWRRYGAISACFALVMIAVGVVFGVAGLSVFLAVFGFVQFLPQLRLSASQLLRGVVVPGMPIRGVVLRSIYTGLWCVYAVAWGVIDTRVGIDWPLAVWGATGCVAFMLQALVGVRSNAVLNCDRMPLFAAVANGRG